LVWCKRFILIGRCWESKKVKGKSKKFREIVYGFEGNFMTKLVVYFFVLMFAVSSFGQTLEPYKGNISKTVYDLISGDAGQKRDWDKFRTLFRKNAVVILVDSKLNETKTLTVEDYIKTLESEIGNDGYLVSEIDSMTRISGNLTHVFSTFEVRKQKDDKISFLYGVISLQVVSDKSGSQIASFSQQTKPNYTYIKPTTQKETDPKQVISQLTRSSGSRERFAPFDIIGITNVTDVTLSKNEIILNCSSEKAINVSTKATNANNDTLLYNYTTNGGKIIGNGEKVIWDLSDTKPGTYTITAATDNGCGLCGTTVTKTVTVVETGDCPKP
jgi:hypothetical protein